jgi:hypothetical protein
MTYLHKKRARMTAFDQPDEIIEQMALKLEMEFPPGARA